MGTTRGQLGIGLRVMFHHPYAIYYSVSKEELIVFAFSMAHGMLPPSLNRAGFCNDSRRLKNELVWNASANAARSSSAKWSSTKTCIGSATSGVPKEFSSGSPKSLGSRLPDEHM